MGNTANSRDDTVQLPHWERSLVKGYNCHYYVVTTDPTLFQKRKCVVIDHDDTKMHYTLRDIELDLVYEDVPSCFVSSSRVDYRWDDYFKLGIVVKTNATSIDRVTSRGGEFKNRARISNIKTDVENGVTVDLVDLKTGFRAYCIRPSEFALDRAYYNIR